MLLLCGATALSRLTLGLRISHATHMSMCHTFHFNPYPANMENMVSS
jgi:hypothetical protein